MSNRKMMKPVSIAVGAALAATAFAPAAVADTADDPFATTDLDAGYMVANAHEEDGMMDGDKKAHHKKKGHRFDKMDTDGDGSVTLEEHQDYWAAKFAKVDADGDGMVTHEEMKQAKKRHHHKGEKGSEGRCGEEKGEEGRCGGGV